MKLRVAMFYHSLVSDWNHGNAHFLRGIVSELMALGHQVNVFEPEDSWSRENLLKDVGLSALEEFSRAFPELSSRQYGRDYSRLETLLAQTDLIIVHEWNDPELIAAVGRYRRDQANLRIFFHDTHHRALSAENELSKFSLSGYDGVLAYGASLKATYERLGWGRQVHVWHEAADIRTFYPRHGYNKDGDVIWIGNWGDEERTQELREYFIAPVRRAGLRAQVYGVRYPQSAQQELHDASIAYCGWCANFRVPELFARFKATVHVPRRPYVQGLPGIPTIRPFEALACGIPLVSAPWKDEEGLFRIGEDFLMAENGRQMEAYLRDVINDPALAASLAAKGLETIRNRHTCKHRVDELLGIYASSINLSAASFEPTAKLPVEVRK